MLKKFVAFSLFSLSLSSFALDANTAPIDHEKIRGFVVEYKSKSEAIAASVLFNKTSLNASSLKAAQSMNVSQKTFDVLSTKASVGAHLMLNSSTALALPEAEKIARELLKDPNVKNASPDYILKPMGYGAGGGVGANLQWHLGSDYFSSMNFKYVWSAKTEGTNRVSVAVIDTGYVPHPDLSPVIAEYDFITNTTNAGDGDGWDSSAKDEGDFCSSTGSNSSWHGTLVSGVVSTKFNSASTFGGAANVNLIHARALGRCGGSMSDIITAIYWAAGQTLTSASGATVKLVVPRADVINLSLGADLSSQTPCPGVLQSAVDYALGAGSVLVAATGNSSRNYISFPANCTGVIAVGATGKYGDKSIYSNYGAGTSILAPGGDYNQSTSMYDPIITLGVIGTGAIPSYSSYSGVYGTSFSTPVVSSLVALIKSAVPSFAPSQIISVIKQSAKKFPSGASCGNSADCGVGVANAKNAFDYLDTYFDASLKLSGPAGKQAIGANVVLTADFSGLNTSSTNTSYTWSQVMDGGPSVKWIGSGNSISFPAPNYNGFITFNVTATNGYKSVTDKISVQTSANFSPVIANQSFDLVFNGKDAVIANIVVVDSENNFENLLIRGAIPAGVTTQGNVLSWSNPTIGRTVLTVAAADSLGAVSADVVITLNVKNVDTGSAGGAGGGAMGFEVLVLFGLGLLLAGRKQRE